MSSVKALKQLKAAKGRKYDTDWGFPCPSCFVAGTPIKIEGGYANIEDVKVGDFVLAKDVVTGRIEPKRVSQVHIRPTVDMNSFFALTVSNGLKSEVLRVTGEHPFWVKDEKQWVEVNDLKVGDTLIDHDGKAIELIAKETIPEFEQTYNLTVEGFHTYFAGKLETLVHNCGPKGPKSSDFSEWRKKQTYEDAPYHTSGNSTKNPKPSNPDIAFDNSYSIGNNTTRRIGVDKNSGEFVVFDQSGAVSTKWHGHSRSWGELNQQMQNALRKSGVVTNKGKIR